MGVRAAGSRCACMLCQATKEMGTLGKSDACPQCCLLTTTAATCVSLIAGQARDCHAAAERCASAEVQAAGWPVDGRGGELLPLFVLPAPADCLKLVPMLPSTTHLPCHLCRSSSCRSLHGRQQPCWTTCSPTTAPPVFLEKVAFLVRSYPLSSRSPPGRLPPCWITCSPTTGARCGTTTAAATSTRC